MAFSLMVSVGLNFSMDTIILESDATALASNDLRLKFQLIPVRRYFTSNFSENYLLQSLG